MSATPTPAVQDEVVTVTVPVARYDAPLKTSRSSGELRDAWPVKATIVPALRNWCRIWCTAKMKTILEKIIGEREACAFEREEDIIKRNGRRRVRTNGAAHHDTTIRIGVSQRQCKPYQCKPYYDN